MSHSHPSRTLPPAALREFTKVAKADWRDGVPLAELLARVNRVAVALGADDELANTPRGRTQRIFTERSFRHYQTLGCIDVPDKRGCLANYGFRHFLQALLLRKLLWERMSAEQIATLLVGRGTDELQRMLLGGVEIVAREGGGPDDAAEPSGSNATLAEMWKRVLISRGVELHISTERPRYKPEEFREVLARLREALRKQGY